MHLAKIISDSQRKNNHSVPDWMIGCFKRRSITFANGLSDTTTDVFWLQSRNMTIDLRLPKDSDRVLKKPISEYTSEEIYKLSQYEGWYAKSHWQNEQLSWSGGCSLQDYNRWPEPAILRRVGDCMIEFSPINTYVEDWRLLSLTQGPLLGLRLIEELDISTGQVRHDDGALIINGEYAAIVLGGSETQDVFHFETSVAQGNLLEGYRVSHSTVPSREGEGLFPLDGFEWENQNILVQHFLEHGVEKQRRFSIDTIEQGFHFTANTGFSPAAQEWFDGEQGTLGRYLRQL